jgi:hypothetical protein
MSKQKKHHCPALVCSKHPSTHFEVHTLGFSTVDAAGGAKSRPNKSKESSCLSWGSSLRRAWLGIQMAWSSQIGHSHLKYKVVPPSYKLVYKPHEYYRYITYKP